jgi:hypothetical protein
VFKLNYYNYYYCNIYFQERLTDNFREIIDTVYSMNKLKGYTYDVLLLKAYRTQARLKIPIPQVDTATRFGRRTARPLRRLPAV